MKKFELPKELKFNRGFILDPASYLKDAGCTSWLFLVGEEFAGMENGMSYQQVQEAAPISRNVISDPRRELTLELAKEHVKALDELPRPTLISCRTGPRASAVAYMYAGLKSGANPEDVLEAAMADGAPFTSREDYMEWVRTSIEMLR